ncbi:YgaP family membrane protein [Effusibacillus dendaii]|uniref:Inner membrane protein YgaP-like transmembrane domain-containing protein n=1 Tax=Effusibacillus dendaii TaxID=2743772 RepID=A0A7I8D7Q9_9BACL|nr:DUF2892 domain-containing protein [Effusibacillus dendaii]BCJ86178.1 hypothetical protein skT53_11630 [Effusibacillus dendaii]
MIKQNVGNWDAYLRLTAGFTGLAFGIRRLIEKNDTFAAMMVMASAMKVAEGVTRICPLMHLMGVSTAEKQPKHLTYTAHDEFDQTKPIPDYAQ